MAGRPGVYGNMSCDTALNYKLVIAVIADPWTLPMVPPDTNSTVTAASPPQVYGRTPYTVYRPDRFPYLCPSLPILEVL